MRRSEMIEILAVQLRQSYGGETLNLEKASYILLGLENAGMLPPPTTKQQVHKNIEKLDIYNRVLFVGDFITTGEVNEWETE